MNSDSKFAAFYVTFIAVALVGSLYAGHLNPSWNRIAFTFPPEMQKVVENGTAIMEIQWRWLPDTLEMIVKVNDDDFDNKSCCDTLGLLFDSDNDGNLSRELWPAYTQEDIDDHGVFITATNVSMVIGNCVINPVPYDYYGIVIGQKVPFGGPNPDFIAWLNSSYCLYREGEGYTFKVSIPIEVINVKSPTPLHISFTDHSFAYRWPPDMSWHEGYYVIFADFEA